jgi:transposase
VGNQQDGLQLRSEEIGAQPLIQPLVQRLRLRDFFDQAFGRPDARLKLPHVDSALLLVRNFVLSRHPLYGVPAWAQRFDPVRLELNAEQVALLNDDRLGRLLDKLFLVDRRTLMTRIIVHMVEEFGIERARIHNDSTSVTFCGEYPEGVPRADGRKVPRIVHGYNKDHRPDLKQLVWTLSITDDGGVPVHYNVDDGNVNDDQTHRQTWDILHQIIGTPRFIYTADCKLCTRANMSHIAERGGWFITVLPRSRKEEGEFKRWIVDNPVPWEVIWERAALRRKGDPPDIYEAYEDSRHITVEGYRVVWFRSSEKWVRDEGVRQQAIDRARYELHQLKERVGRRRLKQRRQVQAAVTAILTSTGAAPWVRVTLVARERHWHKQQTPGRPTWRTSYLRVTTTVWEPVLTIDPQAVRACAAADGIFPLVTNLPRHTHPPLQILKIYKYQAFIEKRHEQLKTAAEVVPVNFKSPARIDAFLFLFFIAITIHALLERQLRKAMNAHGIESLPLYPEARQCKTPTADKLLALFEHQRRHRLLEAGRHLKTFWDPLSDIQRTVLQLLHVPLEEYGSKSQ